MSQVPLRHAHGNILFGRPAGHAGLYRLGTVSYPFLPESQKMLHALRLAAAISRLGASCSIWRVHRTYPAGRYVGQAQTLLDPHHGDPVAWEDYLAGHAAELEQMAPQEPEVYMAVGLRAEKAGQVLKDVAEGLGRVRRRLEDAAGVGEGLPVSGTVLAALEEDERRAFETLRSHLGHDMVARARTEELQWLHRRAPLRGVGEPRLDPHWQPNALILSDPDGGTSYRPKETLFTRLGADPVTERSRHLEFDTDRGTVYQAMLCLGALPEEPDWPGAGCELLYAPLDALDFPVDAVLHFTYTSNREALANVRRRIVDADNVYRDELEGSRTGASWHSEENRVLARELESYLRCGSHPPLLYGWVGLAVGADSLERLERRCALLQEAYGDIVLERPRSLQALLFAEHLPRCGSAIEEYDDVLTVEQVGTMVPAATHRSGSLTGVYLGFTPVTERPIKFDVTEASRADRPSAILAAGTLGSGKTVACQMIAYAAAQRGSLVVDVDPKPDHNLHLARGLEGRVERVELSGDPASRGVLDPLLVPPLELREETALSYFFDLLHDRKPGWRSEVQKAVRETVEREERSSLAMLERLKATGRTAALEVYEELATFADFGMGRLGFGDGGADDLEAVQPVTTIRTPGLLLPGLGITRENYSLQERIAVATLSLLASYALRLVSGERTRHKVVLMDEAWFLLASQQGQALFNRLIRLGRAQNATILIATQRLADLGELENLIGTRLIFGMETDHEARIAVELLGLDPRDLGLVNRVRSYRRGLCLMRDIHGQIAELQIDPGPELLEAFNTSIRASTPTAA